MANQHTYGPLSWPVSVVWAHAPDSDGLAGAESLTPPWVQALSAPACGFYLVHSWQEGDASYPTTVDCKC